MRLGEEPGGGVGAEAWREQPHESLREECQRYRPEEGRGGGDEPARRGGKAEACRERGDCGKADGEPAEKHQKPQIVERHPCEQRLRRRIERQRDEELR